MTAATKTRAVVAPSVALLDMQGGMKLTIVEVRQHVGHLLRVLDRAEVGADKLHDLIRVRDAALISEFLMASGVWPVAQAEREDMVAPWLQLICEVAERRRGGDTSRMSAGELAVLRHLVDWYRSLLTESTRRQLAWAHRQAARQIADGVEQERREGAPASASASYGVGPSLATMVAEELRRRRA